MEQEDRASDVLPNRHLPPEHRRPKSQPRNGEGGLRAPKVAYNLKRCALHKGAVVLALGPFSEPQYLQLKNSHPHLFKLAGNMYLHLSRDVGKVFQAIAQHSTGYMDKNSNFGPAKALGLGLQRLASQDLGFVNKPLQVAKYFWKCLDKTKNTGWPLRREMPSLLENKLVLHKAAVAGEGIYEDFFLCVDVQAVDVP